MESGWAGWSSTNENIKKMKELQLKATLRREFGKSAVKDLRRKALVPCVLYGNKQENIHFTVVEKELKDLLFTQNSYIISLDVEGQKHFCILYDVQYHPVSDRPIHMDFLAVNETDPVTISVPVVITGHAEGVKQGGKLYQMVRKVKIKALKKDLPDDINIDITKLQLGKSIVAGDLKIDGVRILTPKNAIICMVKVTRAAVAETEEPEQQPAS